MGQKRFFIALGFLLLLVAFQNCTPTEFNSVKDKSKAQASGNGDGYSGIQSNAPGNISYASKAIITLDGGTPPYNFALRSGDPGALTVLSVSPTGRAEYSAPDTVSAPFYARIDYEDAAGEVGSVSVGVGFDGFIVIAPTAIGAGDAARIVVEGPNGPFSFTVNDGGAGTLELISSTAIRTEYIYRVPNTIATPYDMQLLIEDRQGYEESRRWIVSP